MVRKKLSNDFVENLRFDLPASFVIFLVALPLCLGIALASDAPLFSGIISGIVGGIIVGLLSGSEVSVSGPAAGLTIIVASGIARLGNYELFLAAVILAGVIQILFSLCRLGFLAALFPNSVIKGMLAAIGITLIIKEIPHALGGLGHFESELSSGVWFGQNSIPNDLWAAFLSSKVSAVGITLLSFLIMIFWEKDSIKKIPVVGKVPAPLIVIAISIVINQIFHARFPDLALHETDGHLVTVPNFESFSHLLNEFRAPNFSGLTSLEVWSVALTVATAGSIQSLISIESVDKLDPFHRVSNSNRELLAQGVGNLVCGLLGGIPLTSVIVRSSANIYAGARTRISTIGHGFILLLSVLFLGPILNLIPLAALAAVLIMVGYRLAQPVLFRQMLSKGLDQFIPFMVTLIAILFTDLLKGFVIGMIVGMIFVVKASFYSAIQVVHDGKDVLFRFSKDLTFIHKIKLKAELLKIEPGSRVYFDGSRAIYIDRDAYEMIQEFSQTAAKRKIKVELRDISIKSLPKVWPKIKRRKKNGST